MQCHSFYGLINNPKGELYYFVDFENIRVIVLNTRNLPYKELSENDINVNHHKISDEQVDWFRKEALNTDKQVLIMSHVPLNTQENMDNKYIILWEIGNFIKKGGTVIGCFAGHTHVQKLSTYTAEDLGVSYKCMEFANGGDFAEIVMIDTNNKCVNTKIVGYTNSHSQNILDRSYNY